LYFRFPLSLRLVEELLLERGIVVSYETIRRRAEIRTGLRGANPPPAVVAPGRLASGRGGDIHRWP
jgi:hypothetical protein